VLEKKLHNEEFHSVYSSLNTTGVNKSITLIGTLAWQKVLLRKGRTKAQMFRTGNETYNIGLRKVLLTSATDCRYAT
jgi:hypothetical protein